MADDYEQAIANLRLARAALAERIERIDRALADLTGDPRASVPATVTVVTPASGSVVIRDRDEIEPSNLPDRIREPRKGKRPPGHVGVKTRVRDLLKEADRDWSATEIRDEYTRRGTPIHRPGARDPTSPIRTALLALIDDGEAVRVGDGRYRWAKYALTAPGNFRVAGLAYGEGPA